MYHKAQTKIYEQRDICKVYIVEFYNSILISTNILTIEVHSHFSKMIGKSTCVILVAISQTLCIEQDSLQASAQR